MSSNFWWGWVLLLGGLVIGAYVALDAHYIFQEHKYRDLWGLSWVVLCAALYLFLGLILTTGLLEKWT